MWGAFDRAKAELVAGDDELVPAAVADALISGENPVRVWRQYRDLSQDQLAAAAGISQAYVAQIEGGKRDGTLYRHTRVWPARWVSIWMTWLASGVPSGSWSLPA